MQIPPAPNTESYHVARDAALGAAGHAQWRLTARFTAQLRLIARFTLSAARVMVSFALPAA